MERIMTVSNRLIWLSVIVFGISFIFTGCVATAPSQKIENTGRESTAMEIEIWELRLTGDTVGNYKLKLKRRKNEKGFYEISGNFRGPMEDNIWGGGEMACVLKGKIEDYQSMMGNPDYREANPIKVGQRTNMVLKF